MKDQKAILNKCLINDWPAFVIAGTDICAVETMEAYYEIANWSLKSLKYFKKKNQSILKYRIKKT